MWVTDRELTRAIQSRLASCRLIAIDGLPLAGKSTLAQRLAHELRLQVLAIDDFVLPPKQWPKPVAPAFPFPFFRVNEFSNAVEELRRSGRATWRPIDWTSLELALEPIELVARGPVIVEGCSVMAPHVSFLYDQRIFVESDRASLMAARATRDGDNALAPYWETLFVPSADRYMLTDPKSRADYVVAGRGIGQVSPPP